jgi:D-alanyl-D-alanine carboxypeptidase/D-alanyl-D-alanine-endopeptidase (penicillin-binding protein 4)
MSIRTRVFPVAILIAAAALAAAGPVTAHAGAAKPAVSRDQLAAQVTKALRRHGAAHLNYSIYDPAYGTFSHDETAVTAPASNEKIFTTATLLQLVGPTFQYATTVAGTAALTSHTLHGDLVVTGSGDPTLSRAALLTMAKSLHQKGLHRVSGHLIVDDTRYSQRTVVPGWKPKFVPEETGTVDAFTVDHNVWRGGTSFFHHPTLYNARLFRAQLKRRHIGVAKKIEIRKAPPDLTPLVTHHSGQLSGIVHATLTESINFDAEMMFREAGAQLTGHGSPTTGLEAERTVAKRLGGLQLGVVHDGSGLSYSDRSSPEILRQWLVRLQTTPYHSSFYDSLPVSCRTGTLRFRMCGPNLAGRVHAKTGTLNHVSTLSGYVASRSGQPLTFSFLGSGVRNYAKLYDAIGRALSLLRDKG